MVEVSKALGKKLSPLINVMVSLEKKIPTFARTDKEDVDLHVCMFESSQTQRSSLNLAKMDEVKKDTLLNIFQNIATKMDILV